MKTGQEIVDRLRWYAHAREAARLATDLTFIFIGVNRENGEKGKTLRQKRFCG
jgi:hypothetical protein